MAPGSLDAGPEACGVPVVLELVVAEFEPASADEAIVFSVVLLDWAAVVGADILVGVDGAVFSK